MEEKEKKEEVKKPVEEVKEEKVAQKEEKATNVDTKKKAGKKEEKVKGKVTVENKKTNKKSPIIAIIIVVILRALVGVVYVTLQNTPKSVVNGMFKALKDGNYEKVNEYINYQEVISSSDVIDSENLDTETMNLLFNKLDWKIIETTQEGNNASVTVEVTNKNFKTIIGNYMQNALRVAFSGQELSDAEMENYLIEELKKEDMETATITQTINLTKQDGKWVINTTDTSLVEILLPGLNEAINSLS